MIKEFPTKGLRTRETIKFKHFFSIVQNKAMEENKVFFLDCGEGRELITEELDGEDLSGWLIPKEQVALFEASFINHRDLDEWVDFVTFAIWKINDGKVDIDFKTY